MCGNLLKYFWKGFQKESGVGIETGLYVSQTDKAVFDFGRDEEGDVEAREAEELGQLQHGVDVALRRVWED